LVEPPEVSDPDPVVVAVPLDTPEVEVSPFPEPPVGEEEPAVVATIASMGESATTVHSLPAADHVNVGPLAGVVISPAISYSV
jgi:hypothetical protein